MTAAAGRRGSLLAAGRPVALLGHWSLARYGTTWQLAATIAEVQDAYLLENASTFTVRLNAGAHLWQWRNAAGVCDGREARFTMEGTSECLETDS